MKDKPMLQIIALIAIMLVSGFFIFTGMFSVFIWLWTALLIASTLSLLRKCDVPISFS